MTKHSDPVFKLQLAAANSVLQAAGTSVEMSVTVSAVAGIKSFAFACDGVPLPAKSRRFQVTPGTPRVLSWAMVGNAGSTMNVKVMNGNALVAERTASTIRPGRTNDFDMLLIAI